ncbi:MAG: CRTAC1 family protein, partial [Candidatus Latescibacteria bacterium]|nr:CRTAC1 family protein [Candidatus Latescibacterota bacterium]
VRQVRERHSGGSYLASHDPRLHFGLGANTHARVEVRWPDGQIQQLGEVAADQFLKLEEP